MWKQWDREVVADDFARLAAHGVTTLRVFPLWSDFQPINQLRHRRGKCHGNPFRRSPLPSGEIGRAGVSADMLERFGLLADLAEKEGIALIVGLITGWMSGRLYVPPALEGAEPDHGSRVDSLAGAFHQDPRPRLQKPPRHSGMGLRQRMQCHGLGHTRTGLALDLYLGRCHSQRRSDATGHFGMHSLPVESGKPWSIYDQGELTDILTTHPYPLFTPHCNREPMDTIRPLLHSTAETSLMQTFPANPPSSKKSEILALIFARKT